MNVLKNNVEKIVFAAVVIGCVLFAMAQLRENDDVMKKADEDREKIEKAKKAKVVSPNYEFSEAKRNANLNFPEIFTGNQQRSAQPVRGDIPGWVAYPQPERPLGEQKLPVPVEEFFAEMAGISEFKVMAEQGRNIVAFKKPEAKSFKFMELVRVEIYRGKSADKMEKIETVSYAPEEGAAPAPEAPKEAPKAAPEVGRRPRTGAPAAGGRNAPPVPVNPLAGFTVVIDTNIEQKVKYFYKAVPIARMTRLPDVQEIKKNPLGDPEKILIYRGPKDAAPTPPTSVDAKVALFKGAATDTKDVLTPSNFQIRLAGTTGTLSPPGTQENRMSRDYKGNFEVKVWVPEASAFKEITMQAAPGENLKGQLSYKTADGKDTKVVDFDSGYQLVEIKWGTKGGEETMPDGSKRTSPVIPNEEAVLMDLKSKKTEIFPKRAEFERKSDNLKYYEALDKERREMEKINQERMRAASERVKAFDEANKKPQ